MPAEEINPGVLQLLRQYLPGAFQGTVSPMKKPVYQDTFPVWKDQLILGLQEQNDIRRFTQIRCWIKPPSERFPQANVFLSLINAKGSVFVRLNNIDELKALQSSLAAWIPQIEAKLEELKPMETQIAAAKQAFDTIMTTGNHEHPEEASWD